MLPPFPTADAALHGAGAYNPLTDTQARMPALPFILNYEK
jgi:hypothetical protein